MFLFSLETQTTIGYGGRSAASNCGLTIFTVIVQSVFGCVLDAFMIGLIMAKVVAMLIFLFRIYEEVFKKFYFIESLFILL